MAAYNTKPEEADATVAAAEGQPSGVRPGSVSASLRASHFL